jgi:hypothetical protein
LKELHYETYQSYLSSSWWSAVKVRFYASEFATKKDDKFCCKACEATDVKLNVHHLYYDTLGAEKSNDLCLLCDSCHSEVHSRGGNIAAQTDELIFEKHEAKSDQEFLQKVMKCIAEHFYDISSLKKSLVALLEKL